MLGSKRLIVLTLSAVPEFYVHATLSHVAFYCRLVFSSVELLDNASINLSRKRDAWPFEVVTGMRCWIVRAIFNLAVFQEKVLLVEELNCYIDIAILILVGENRWNSFRWHLLEYGVVWSRLEMLVPNHWDYKDWASFAAIYCNRLSLGRVWRSP